MALKVEEWDGNPISKPCIVRGLPLEIYHSGHACVGLSMSSSGLRTIFNESEAHYWDSSPYNPDRAPPKESGAFTLGRAVHHALLGEANFSKTFVVELEEAPDGRAWNGNNGSVRKWVAAQKAAGLTILSRKELAQIQSMALALGKESLVVAGALNGLIECTMAWQDKETGVWLLARPDNIPTDSGDFVDLKTTASTLYNDLVRTIGDYGYNQQGALVGEGYEILTGEKMATFSLYFVESKRPHCARLVQLKDHDLVLGKQQNRNALRRFVEGMNSGVWPGPGGRQASAQHIEISEYARKAIEGRLKFEGTDL